MFRNFGVQELLIILVIVLLLFGVGRVSKIGKELGGAINSFRKGLKGDETEEKKEEPNKEELK
jgi:sec-independent protein translocase protein TatA